MKDTLYETRALTDAAPPPGRTRPSPLNPSAAPPLLLTLLLFCVASPAPSARGQAKPNIAGDVETKKRVSERAAPKPAPEGRPNARRRQAPATRQAPAPAAPLEVVFYTGLADSDVYLNVGQSMQKLGRAGRDGRLAARLPRGVHNVTASRPGSPVQRKQIDVRPGSTTFVFNLSAAAPSPFDAPASSVLTAEDVFRRFLDPKLTDGVTAAEWQLAQSETAAAFAANPLDPQVEAQALFARGQLAFLRRDYQRALLDFNASALRLPASALAYYGLGNAYLGAGRLGEAARAFQHATELSPALAMAYKGWGDVLARQNKNREALRYYERARVLGYTSPDTRQVAARILLKERRWSEALRELLEVSKAAPTAEVFVGIGDAYVGLGQPLSAAPAYRRALELDPKSAAAHFKYGELAYEQREYAAAADSLERALALDPTGALIDRGRARDMANKAASKARAAW